ncbi:MULTISPECIES: GAF and ANTAR domain-containing protein [unclassified Nocardioides]|uniref:GAF and ANTAR domain-containing protein n=1 Tax=unclassified Nocardioides TaxID=2615069 RepID=UPI00005707D4|nr:MULTISPECIES: GAF and ANTAR domain-containing protein [unclassified Nocardioides]ABL81434.1 ANTAR domain protein [Nocardioides sp. JS614]
MSGPRTLAAQFAELSGDLLSDPDETVTFERVVQRAVETIPACTMAGIMLRVRRGRVQTVAATHDDVERLDQLQHEHGEGPCLDVAFDRENCIVQQTATDTRYPRWAADALDRGVRAAMAIRLHTETETLGALNLYADRAGAFDQETVDVALIYAAHATEAMRKARLVSGLQAALESRHLIGMAQGVLAVRYGLTYERAFDVLHRFSNDHNVKLRDLARQVIEDRGLPGDRPDDERAGTDQPGGPSIVS